MSCLKAHIHDLKVKTFDQRYRIYPEITFFKSVNPMSKAKIYCEVNVFVKGGPTLFFNSQQFLRPSFYFGLLPLQSLGQGGALGSVVYPSSPAKT